MQTSDSENRATSQSLAWRVSMQRQNRQIGSDKASKEMGVKVAVRDGEAVAADSVAGFLNWSCKVGSLAEVGGNGRVGKAKRELQKARRSVFQSSWC